MASIERSQNNCDLATPAYIRKLYLPVARKHSTYTNVMHDKYSTCKHERATCTCQIVSAQIAEAGQLQDNEVPGAHQIRIPGSAVLSLFAVSIARH